MGLGHTLKIFDNFFFVMNKALPSELSCTYTGLDINYYCVTCVSVWKIDYPAISLMA